MADATVAAVRLAMRTLPGPLRERMALRLFLTTRHYDEPPRELEIRAKGTEIVVGGCQAVSFGPESAPTAVLIHGWSGRGLQLSSWVEPLVDAGYRVIAMDGPACGRNPGNSSSIPVWVTALRQMIQEVNPACIVGHSFGSLTSILAVAEENARTDILCLGGPAQPPDVIDGFRQYVRAPLRGRQRFIDLLCKKVGITPEDVDVANAADRLNGRLHAVVTIDDEDMPWEDSVRIVEGAGGSCTVLEDAGHRAIMWNPAAIEAGLQFLLEDA